MAVCWGAAMGWVPMGEMGDVGPWGDMGSWWDARSWGFGGS